jgi:malate dehydrogenase
VALCSKGDYGVEAGLISSFPMRTNADGGMTLVQGVPIAGFSRSRIDSSVAELQEERELVRDLLV